MPQHTHAYDFHPSDSLPPKTDAFVLQRGAADRSDGAQLFLCVRAVLASAAVPLAPGARRRHQCHGHRLQRDRCVLLHPPPHPPTPPPPPPPARIHMSTVYQYSCMHPPAHVHNVRHRVDILRVWHARGRLRLCMFIYYPHTFHKDTCTHAHSHAISRSPPAMITAVCFFGRRIKLVWTGQGDNPEFASGLYVVFCACSPHCLVVRAPPGYTGGCRCCDVVLRPCTEAHLFANRLLGTNRSH